MESMADAVITDPSSGFSEYESESYRSRDRYNSSTFSASSSNSLEEEENFRPPIVQHFKTIPVAMAPIEHRKVEDDPETMQKVREAVDHKVE